MAKKKRADVSRRRIQQQLSGPAPTTTIHKRPTDREDLAMVYMRAAEWAVDNPTLAGQIKALDEDTILHLVMGIAYAQELGHSDEDCVEKAGAIMLWCIMNGFVYLYEWPMEVALMGERSIIDAIRADRQAGRLPPMITDEESST